ncbi:hypothetical protein RHRU231_40094 [Rhodococcus ruber]|uniref:Uncharacterized protein n=1 Tax=Rhodococcus ruber TaxID=1830 RepID=A0A098BHZ4_9NOCA|nr:hypothetical protein RHRU231_40094 [Rhodococcus ruber]
MVAVRARRVGGAGARRPRPGSWPNVTSLRSHRPDVTFGHHTRREGSELAGAQLVTAGGLAATGDEVPLPAVQVAGEAGALDDAELRQIRLQVRAAALDLEAAQLDRRGIVVGFGEPAVRVGDPLVGEALEERVQEFVVAAHPPRLESGGQEDGVHPVRLVVAQDRAHQLRRNAETVAVLAFSLDGFADDPLGEVQHDRLVAHHQADGVADAVADQIGLRHDRLELRLERTEQRLTLGRGPRRLLGLEHRGQALGHLLDVRGLVGEDLLDVGVGDRMGQRHRLAAVHVEDRAGDHQHATVVAVQAHLLEEDHLVGEDVALVAVVVVEVAQRRVEEHRRTGRRDHPRRPDLVDVAAAAVHAALALLLAEVRLGALGDVVDHRVPDRARVLQQVDVDLPEGLEHRVHLDRAGVVHVEHRGLAVRDDETGVADRSVRGCAQGDDHHVQVALGPADGVLDGIGRLEELREPELLELATQVRDREVGQQHRRVLADVLAQVLRVEVILVQVRDVQVVDVAERTPVQLRVVREGEPRREVRGVDPRVAQDRSRFGLNVEPGVSDAGDLHFVAS